MTAHQPKQPMIQIVVLIIWQDRDCNFFQQYGTAPLVSTQTNSDSDEDDSTTTVSPQQCQKPRQVITKPCKIIMMPLPMQHQS